jgi:hypothetical protein
MTPMAATKMAGSNGMAGGTPKIQDSVRRCQGTYLVTDHRQLFKDPQI